MKSKGAVRNKKSTGQSINLNWAAYVKPLSIAITLACILLSIILLLVQLVNKEVTHLQITGAMKHVSELEIKQRLQGVFPKGFISLSLEDVEERLTSLPMVSHVKVEKVWPDTLKVNIHEEQPVAIWNLKNMLSRHGEILPLALAQLQLPQLKGGDGESRVVMQHFQLFSHWGNRHQLVLQSLNNTASGWQLVFENDFEIWLDKSEAKQGLQHLEHVLHQFNIQRIRRIDMRYEQGFAVAWKEDFQSEVQG